MRQLFSRETQELLDRADRVIDESRRLHLERRAERTRLRQIYRHRERWPASAAGLPDTAAPTKTPRP